MWEGVRECKGFETKCGEGRESVRDLRPNVGRGERV